MATREITDADQLAALLGEPTAAARGKERDRLGEIHRQWLAHSPFCLVATSDAEGRCDVSPKGDPPGFVHVVDDTTLAIPERAGNRRADGYRNILANPHVGLVFFVPGRGDTLRINGRARLLSETPLADEMVVKGHRPVLVMMVDVEQVFFHCAKAFLRSHLWDPGTWHPQAVPSRPVIAKQLERPEADLAELERYYGQAYLSGLYPTT